MKLLPVVLVFALVLTACTFQSGVSTDRIYSYDQGILWNHVYLVNDHSTVYCYDGFVGNEIERAFEENRTVKLYYEKYLFRGALCQTPGDNWEAVVVTRVEE